MWLATIFILDTITVVNKAVIIVTKRCFVDSAPTMHKTQRIIGKIIELLT